MRGKVCLFRRLTLTLILSLDGRGEHALLQAEVIYVPIRKQLRAKLYFSVDHTSKMPQA